MKASRFWVGVVGGALAACGADDSGSDVEDEVVGSSSTDGGAADGDDGGAPEPDPDPSDDGRTEGTDGDPGDDSGEGESGSTGGEPLPDPPETESALGMLAESLQPGECAQLSTEGFAPDLLASFNDGGSITEFTNEAVWDPVERRIYVVGTARGFSAGYGPDNQKLVMYDVATNAWSLPTQPPFYVGFHSYDHAAVDVTNGDYFVRVVHEPTVHRYRPSTDSWEMLPQIATGYGGGCCDLLEYFPEMDSLVFIEHTGSQVEVSGFSDGAWNTIAISDEVEMGTFHLAGEYSPALGLLYFGGGQVYPYDEQFGNEVYTLDAQGTITRAADAPGNFDVASAVTVTDPASGNLLVLPSGASSELWAYDPMADTWEAQDFSCPFSTVNDYGDQVTVATGIPEYGVIMLVKHDTPEQTNNEVVVYKHG